MDFVIGLVALGAVAGGALFAARRGRRVLLPGWSGPPGLLADLVLATTGLVLVAELVGTFGWLHPVPVVVVAAAAIGGVWFASRRVRVARPAHLATATPAVPEERRLAAVAAAVTGGIVTGWAFRAVEAIENGMFETEVFRYHMPKAVRFAQDVPTTQVLFVDPSQGELIAYYPENSELLHALGIRFLGSDFLSHLLNLGGVGILLLAAWTIGRPFGVAWLSTLGAAVVLATPQLAISQPGEATTDLLMVAWLLAAVALVVHGDAVSSPAGLPTYLVAGLAAGLSLGTKYTGLAALLVLTLAAVAHAPRGRRVRSGAVWVGAMAVSGGYFYVRNLVEVGNPLPPFEASLGPIRLPSPPTESETHPLLRVLFDADAWSDHLVDAFRRSLGQGWWLLLVAVLVLAGASLVRARSSTTRFAAVVAVGSLVGFVVTPQVLGQSLEILDNVVYNVRYMTHGLVLALVVAPVVLGSGRVSRRLLAALYLAVVAVTLVSSDFDRMFVVPDVGWVLSIVVIGALVAVAANAPARPTRVAGLLAAAAVFVVVAAIGEATQRDDRFANTRALSPIHQWAFDASDRYIAVTGLPLTYGLNGSDLSNRVEYLGVPGDDGEFLPIEDCRAYREAINDAGYSHVVTWPASVLGSSEPVERSWIGDDAVLVAQTGAASLFALDGELDPDACAPA